MTRYIGILEREPGTLWGVWFPDLPGCITAAETADLAVDRAHEVVALWLEDASQDGETPPVPRSLEELWADPEVSEAFKAGHAALVIPAPALRNAA